MNQDREMERHNRILESIKKATRKEELPNVTASTFSTYLANNVYFDNRRISSKEFMPVFQGIMDYGFFVSYQVKDIFIDILKKNYPGKSEKEYLDKYVEMAKSSKTQNILVEIFERSNKLNQLLLREENDKHEIIMKQIRDAYELKDLPKVSRASITRYISNNSDTSYSDKINVSKLQKLASLLVEGYSVFDIEFREELLKICKDINLDRANEMHEEIMGRLVNNINLDYLVLEVKEKEDRIKFIYKNDHEETMGNIRDARRISQLPCNLSLSTITSYLSGNSIIYPKGVRIPAGEFNNIASLLISGKRFEDREIINELARIILDYYPEKFEEASTIMISKLSGLPKIYYYAEEVGLALSKQKEFISRGSSNVNVYFIPNPNSPIDGGKFYNCYISRAQSLDMKDLSPLKLDEIIPEGMDVDSIEWYVQEKYDPTFKTAGGIILNKDETIGSVSVFQPSDGKIGITPEEHSKYQELEDLSKQVKEIIAKKKKETSDFAKLQEAFLKSQQATDEELAKLEAKIDMLTSGDKGRGGRR